MQSYDLAIVGGGPVGCVAALAHARRGARVLLLEANPRACTRLAGEWLHPPAVEALASVDADLAKAVSHPTGQGFAVFPDDGSDPIVLPYRAGSRGTSMEHSVLVERLRERCQAERLIDYRAHARVTAVGEHRVVFERQGGPSDSARAERIVGAAGRTSVVHQALGVDASSWTYSRMAGLLLRDTTVPFEGYGHVFLGGPGPVLCYRLDEDHVRVCLDVPSSMPVSRNREAVLWEAFRPVLPAQLHVAFLEALSRGATSWAANQTRPRLSFGRRDLVLIGDAVGHHHPLTAIGMTMGFQDAVALAESESFEAFRRRRLRAGRVPEMLAVALYEVFADTSDEVVAIRSAVYEMWRRNPAERQRTMDYLGCQDVAPLRFGGSFVKAVGVAGGKLLGEARRSGQWRNTARIGLELGDRCRWLLSGALRLSEARPFSTAPLGTTPRTSGADEPYGAALKASARKAEVVEHPAAAAQAVRRAVASALPHVALEKGISNLKALQAEDGSWEGECVWCPMLPAQYVIMSHITGAPISEERRRRLLLQFERTRLADGTWGLHELSEPYLFTTALVYVASRILGVEPSAPLLAGARRFINAEGGVTRIPSWGKFWLALLGLYHWDGVNPILPEIWTLPRWVPVHPANYYCHTRLIYLGLASLYGERLGPRDPALQAALRRELHPLGYEAVDWGRARHQLRHEEVITPVHPMLRLAYDVLYQLDHKLISAERRRAVRTEMLEHIRFELRSSDHTCISPVNGLLNLIALWRHDPSDPDLMRALERLDGWFWEDDVDGARITGARSASWDSAFAVQALTAAAPHFDVTAALEQADHFLDTQQIREPQVDTDYRRFFRIDPRGGYCFAGVWHGWPVSDCTAEALLARLGSPTSRAKEDDLRRGAEFILRTQSSDGGFGSYEHYKSDLPLEWLNPAEMFGDSMTEHSYVECTASCISALAAFHERYPEVIADDIERAIGRAARRLRALQQPDGTWKAVWGIHFTYGILFGVRGLMSAGAPPQDPAIKKACRWLKARQRPDGGWGEDYKTALTNRYVEHKKSQVIQTAWALSALLEAHDPDWDAIERAAHFLASRQKPDGSWPKEDPAGIFFYTALLHYELYRAYFPVWALGLFETRRLGRMAVTGATRERPGAGKERWASASTADPAGA